MFVISGSKLKNPSPVKPVIKNDKVNNDVPVASAVTHQISPKKTEKEDPVKEEVESMKQWTSTDFKFPYPNAYSIQLDLMKKIYETLTMGKVGIFESPTGTGKSLSVICSALKWLQNHPNHEQHILDRHLYLNNLKDNVGTWAKDRSSKLLLSSISSSLYNEIDSDLLTVDDTPQKTGISWLDDDWEERKMKMNQEILEDQQKKLELQKLKLNKIRSIENDPLMKLGKRRRDQNKQNQNSKKKKQEETEEEIRAAVDEFLMEEYVSDDEGKKSSTDPFAIDDENSDEIEDELPPALPVRKIFYCSRTHSQLSQFVGEIKRTNYKDKIKVISLGSRQTHCVNKQVQQLKSINRINDKCMDLQAKKEKETLSSCPQYKSVTNQNKFMDYALANIKDIEELMELGRRFEACPYYGTRQALDSCELVTLPYNLLLHKDMRESLNISLLGNIIIIDEAHNLIDSLNSMYSVNLPLKSLYVAEKQLKEYFNRYENRLKESNKKYINEIITVTESIINYLTNTHSSKLLHKKTKIPPVSSDVEAEQKEPAIEEIEEEEERKISSINHFLFDCAIDHINFFKLSKFLKETDLIKKLNGFIDFQLIEQLKNKEREESGQQGDLGDEDEDDSVILSPIALIKNFIESLTNADKDGRILVQVSKKLSRSGVQFLLLNAERHFSNVLKEAHSVILLGGTLQPFNEFTGELLEGKEAVLFSCSHVMPKENLITFSISNGPSNVPFNFSYKNRGNSKVMEEVGNFIVNICNIVPDGMVIFLPSYQYMDLIVQHWKKSSVFQRISAKKKIFVEPKQNPKLSEETFLQYKQYIATNRTSDKLTTKGAALICVVGGKMSEGINFSDELGRCVIMVGLPFPNPNDPLLNEKLKYFTEKHSKTSHLGVELASPLQSEVGKEYYENLCMKAVNQSIGRSIRHYNDYSCILLLDDRYSQPRIKNKLPKWIQDTYAHHNSFAPAFAAIRKFFVNKKPK